MSRSSQWQKNYLNMQSIHHLSFRRQTDVIIDTKAWQSYTLTCNSIDQSSYKNKEVVTIFVWSSFIVSSSVVLYWFLCSSFIFTLVVIVTYAVKKTKLFTFNDENKIIVGKFNGTRWKFQIYWNSIRIILEWKKWKCEF